MKRKIVAAVVAPMVVGGVAVAAPADAAVRDPQPHTPVCTFLTVTYHWGVPTYHWGWVCR